jgi:hypothetical protein
MLLPQEQFGFFEYLVQTKRYVPGIVIRTSRLTLLLLLGRISHQKPFQSHTAQYRVGERHDWVYEETAQ